MKAHSASGHNRHYAKLRMCPVRAIATPKAAPPILAGSVYLLHPGR